MEESRVNESACQGVPIMPITDLEMVAYVEEEKRLVANVDSKMPALTRGRSYEIITGDYPIVMNYTAPRVHLDVESNRTYIKNHMFELRGQDRYIQITDDNKLSFRFLSNPDSNNTTQISEAKLWDYFEKPKVKTVAEVNPSEVDRNKRVLRACEKIAGFTYYPGQFEFYARVGSRDFGLIGAETGTGKTVGAISLVAMKAPKRALIVSLKGTSTSKTDSPSSMSPSQWAKEFRKFSPGTPIYELFSEKDYSRLKKDNGGELPRGVYLSYYEAMFINGGKESIPSSWDDSRLKREVGIKHNPDDIGRFDLAEGIGEEKNGIRCIVKPCLATIVSEEFEFIAYDEAHKGCNLSATTTQMMIRMQARYRYCFTATPIPNNVINLFSIMGWVCVEGWHRGGRRNLYWPYAREEQSRFADTFLTLEYDLTTNQERQAKKLRPLLPKSSPTISSPARLLKILRPTLAYISKKKCNPGLPSYTIHDIRVPMGKQQAAAYKHFMNRANIPHKGARMKAAIQISYLRGITAAPASMSYSSPFCTSNFNPKTVAALELIQDIRSKGEQVVVVSSRIDQTTAIIRYLGDKGIKCSRIDTTTDSSKHCIESDRFKRKETDVMFMGIKCAAGHDFPDCPNLIVVSLEYSYGAFNQTIGRVYRVNSKKHVNIYCILHKQTIEEAMFDVVSQKGDAANICLRGERVDINYRQVSADEILAASILSFKEECHSICEHELFDKFRLQLSTS